MADLKKTIDIVLNGEDRASKHIRAVNKSMGNLGPKFASVAKGGVAAAAAVTAVATAVSALVAAGLKQAYDQAVLFESAMVDLEKVLGDQPEELGRAKVAAMELSNQYGVSSGEIIDSIAGWVQAGYDIQEATKLAEESIALLYTSELDAAQATTTLTKIMKGFGVETDDARSKLDAVNEISNNYAANVGMLTESLSRVAPIASAAGISFEEMAALLTPALEKFQNGERVGTAFATILNRIVDDAQPVQEALSTLGVKQKDANGQFKSGRDLIYEVGDAFQDLNPSQKQFIAQQLAGTEQSAKFLATMNSWDKVSGVYQTAINSAGSVTDELAAKLESAEKQIDRWNVSWENLSVTIGDQFKVAATEAVKGGTDIVNAIRESIGDGDLDPFFDELESMLSATGEQLEEIADALPEAMEGVNWQGLAQDIGSLGDSIAGLFDGLDLTKPEDLQTAIQGIVDTTGTLTEFTGNVVTGLEYLGEAFVWAADLVNDFFVILRDIDGSVDFFQTAIGLLIGYIEGLYEAIGSLPGMEGLMEGPIESIREWGTYVAAATMEVDKAGTKIDEMKNKADNFPEKKDFKVDVSDDGAIEDTELKIKKVPDDLDIKIKTIDDEVDKTARKIEEELPETKRLKMELDADIRMANIEAEVEKFKSQNETIQESLEWNAKLDIAQAEVEAEKLKTVFDSVNTAIESTGTSIGDAMGSFGQDMSTTQKWAVEDYFDAEAERRQKAFEQQQELVKQQTKLNDMKIDKMESGESMMNITVDDSVEPALKLVMMNVLELMQTEFNEMADQFLLGWESVS